MKKEDKKALERYQKKLELIQQGGQVNAFETDHQRQAAIEKAKKDVRFCVKRYFPHYATSECADFQIAFAIMVLKDSNFTGFAKWGRGLAKSVWCNIIIPFWLWLNGIDMYFVLVGVSEKKAIQLLSDLKAEFEVNPQIIADFGEQKKPGSWNDELWVTNGGFIGQALGFGQSCRGLRVGPKRPSMYSCDDLETKKTIKNEKRQDEMVEYVEEELLASMDGENERLLFPNNWFAPVMFLKKLAAKHPDWVVHEVKAYDPITYEPRWKEKYTKAYYRRKEKKMGVTSAKSEYNHEAKLKGGKIFKSEYVQWVKLPRIDHFKAIICHWDVAYAGRVGNHINDGSDYNAVRIWGVYKEEFYLIHCFVQQTKMLPAVKYMIEFKKSLPKNVDVDFRVESQFWNDEVRRTVEDAKRELNAPEFNLTESHNKRNKFRKIIDELEARYQNGRIKYNIKLKHHKDTQIGMQQLFGIHHGYTTKDDAPDADAEAIHEGAKYIYSAPEGQDSWNSGKMKSVNQW
ncbi:hypothetical protein [Pseudotenacibaculum haliotis]|uniref:Terminase n=1 Tax=Pseudotenacibaculum haliotis TaxID=1862138 RepID=A0ABW5LNU4_9FLAO